MKSFWLHLATKKYLQMKDAGELPEPESNYLRIDDENAQGVVALNAAKVPQKYWQPTPDGTLREMTQSEKDATDGIERDNRHDDMAAILEREGFWRAFAEILLDEFNALRALHGLPARDLSQLRAAMKAKLDQS